MCLFNKWPVVVAHSVTFANTSTLMHMSLSVLHTLTPSGRVYKTSVRLCMPAYVVNTELYCCCLCCYFVVCELCVCAHAWVYVFVCLARISFCPRIRGGILSSPLIPLTDGRIFVVGPSLSCRSFARPLIRWLNNYFFFLLLFYIRNWILVFVCSCKFLKLNVDIHFNLYLLVKTKQKVE